MLGIVIGVLVAVLTFSPLTILAQEPAPEDTPFLLPVPLTDTAQATGPLNCFDYYTFGSVQADIQPSLNQTVPGTTLTFLGEVENNNSYPLVDGTLYVKIFKKDESTFSEGDGNIVVDQFVVKDNISIPGNGVTEVSYDWSVPLNAEGGEYYAAYFFTTAQRYNLLGLSFTDDVVGNKAFFTITADTATSKLSKTETSINGRNHHFAAFPLRFAAGEVITIRTTITNETDQQRVMPLMWSQYAWDSMLPDNLRYTKTEVISLAPNETKEVFYEVQPQRESIVYVTAVTQDIEAKSILNIRYVREGIEETRINFPGISSFPLAKDQDHTLFACAHSTNLPVVSGNILTLTLTDRGGNIIHEYKYEGDISGAMAGFGETFRPDKNINYVILTATLERNGVVVEQVTQTYDCTVIDSSSCLPEDKDHQGTFFDMFTYKLFVGVSLFIGLAIVLLLYIRKRRNYFNSDSVIPGVLFLVLIFPGALLTLPQQTEAKSVQWTTQYSNAPYVPYSYVFDDRHSFHYCWSRQWNQPVPNSTFESRTCSTNRYEMAMLNPNVTITYNATLLNLDTNTPVQDGDTIPQGTRLRLQTVPHTSADISWFATGYSQDSPNGDWVAGAPAPRWILQPYVYTDCPTGTSPYRNFLDGNTYCDNPATWFSLETIAPLSVSRINSIGPECAAKDFVGYGTGLFAGSWAVHIPFVVNPPTAKTTAVSSNLSCSPASVDSAGTLTQDCVVNSTGPISIAFNIPATYGRFYYRYWDTSRTVPRGSNFVDQYEGCYGNDAPLRTGRKANPSALATSLNPDYGPFQATIPAQTIPFSLTASPPVPANNPPSVSIAGPTSGTVNTTYVFSFTASDPEGHQIQYSIDWDNNGSVDQGNPNGIPMNSGQVLSATRVWTTPGTYTFRYWAADVNGAVSGSNTHTITIAPVPPPTADLTINGSNGPVNVPKNTTITLNWSSGNAASCTKWGGTWGSGQGIPLMGSDTTVVTATTDYMINCGGATDVVRVEVVNQVPNAPSITYVSGTRESGQIINFSIQGTDPDNDQIFYEVDWDNNGSVDATTMTVPSNTMQNANRNWNTVGVVTFQARTVDTAGARSGWTSHSETLAPPPPPTATLEIQVDTGGWGTGNPSAIDTNSTLNLRWSSTRATSCSGTNFNSGGATNNTGLGVATPAPGGSTTFTLTCTGLGGTDTKSITVSVGLPNFNQPIATHSLSAGFNPTTGEYDYVDIRFQTTNDGQSGTINTAPYRLQFGSRTPITGTIPVLTRGSASPNFTERINGVPFGATTATIVVDSAGNPGAVQETNENDNTFTYNFGGTIPPPNPNLSLTVSRPVVRAGEVVEVSWNTNTTYPMNCTVRGPGLGPVTFDPSVTGASGSQNSQPITAKSEFTLQCIEPITNTTFTDTASVEVIGTFEEI